MCVESVTWPDDKRRSAKNTRHLSGLSWCPPPARIVCGSMNTAIHRHRFPVLAVVALAAVVFAGFARTYYLKYFFDTPPLRLIAQVHGVLATLWIALHYTQARLFSAAPVALPKPPRHVPARGGGLA